MKKYNTNIIYLVLATALTSMAATAATGVGSINHEIKFGGIAVEGTPKWVWGLPQQNIRVDLQDDEGVVDDTSSTKVWSIMKNRTPFRFLEGNMEPTVSGLALQGLNAEVKYLQEGSEVIPTYDSTDHSTQLALKAVGNISSSAVDGQLALTLQPVLLLAQAENNGDTVLVGKQLANSGVTQASINAPAAYLNAKNQLEIQQAATGATTINYDNNSQWPENMLSDGTMTSMPIIGGYASTITEGKLSFPKESAVGNWQSVITVQVQYK